jgi:hypothetical protein
MGDELDARDRADFARLCAERDDLRARGLHQAARRKQELIDVITGEDED